MSSSRLLILAAALAAMIWFVVIPGLDQPETRGPLAGSASEPATGTEAGEEWNAEERAVWRAQIDHRLRGR
jgi:hypothetical protein